jgi:hypothetical protein
MRKLFFILTVLLMLASACTPDSQTLPTLVATPGDQATPDPNQSTGGEPTATSIIEQAVDVLPPPGTAVVPTQEALVGGNPVRFANILYEESGGPGDSHLLIEVYNDGRVIRDGVQTAVDTAAIETLNQMLVESDFFNIQGQFSVPGASSEVYEYVMRVELETGEARRLATQDNLTPIEIKRLFAHIRDFGL